MCGGPLGMMQGVAWLKMIVTYSQTEGLAEGVKQTFDGDHPCEMCKLIAAAKKQQHQSPEAPAPDQKIAKISKEFSKLDQVDLPINLAREIFMMPRPEELGAYHQVAIEPIVPPPRLA